MSNPSSVKTDSDTVVIPIIAEEASFQKHTVDTGGVRVHTTVHERVETVNEPLMYEEVTVERITVNRRLEGEAPVVRQEGDTLIIPILEEVLVVEKRLVLKEELHVRRIQKTVTQPRQVTLRHEEAEVEPLKGSEVLPQHGARSRELDAL